jgi:hypothetical protein
MRDNRRKTAACGFAHFVFALLIIPAEARAGGTYGYGDIQIEVIGEPKGEAHHGYAEYLFLVSNTSKTQSHRVTLSIPADHHGGSSDLRAIQRSATVEPKEQLRIALYQPVSPPVNGRGVRVVIDDRPQDDAIPVDIHNAREDVDRMGTRHSGLGPGLAPGIRPGSSLLLLSQDVPQHLIDWFRNGDFGRIQDPARLLREWVSYPCMDVRGDLAMPNWSNHWLGYSRYAGIILTRKKLLELPETSRPALWQYVETGGSLTILGEGPVSDGWKAEAAKETPGFTLYRPGFGQCVVAPADYTKWNKVVYWAIGQSWGETGNPLKSSLSVQDTNDRFPVVKDVGIPVRGLFVLMFVFAIIIGPVNISLLARWKRRIWLLWTVPVLSGLTVLAVFGYMFLSEGWSRHLRIEALTIVDENTRHASTVGWTAFYSPVTPGDGLHFSYDTEVTRQGEFIDEDYGYYRSRRSAGRPCFIDLSNEQHFTSGWVSARIPAHFQVRKSESTLLRVSITKGKDGRYSILNGLGNNIKSFWFADDQGRIHRAAGLEAGQRAALDLSEDRLPATPAATMRNLYENDWLQSCRQLRANPEQYLKPLTYLAEVEGSPFLEEALHRAKDRNMHSLVLGIVKELEHER